MKKISLLSAVIAAAIAAHLLTGCDADEIKKIVSRLRSITEGKKEPAKEEPSGEEVALYFKNGDVMVGGLISKTDDEYIINWKGQDTVVFAGQVERVGSPKEALGKQAFVSDDEISQWWPYHNDVAIRLTNGAILDAAVTAVQDEKFSLAYAVEGGGRVEQDIERSRVEYLLFRPVENEENRKVTETLKEFFPHMSFHKTGNFTIVTDSDDLWTKEFASVLRNASTNMYITFFDLLKDRKPRHQNFVVIFDDYFDFLEYAVADGVPGWAVLGYFNPDDKALYLFNMLGDKFSDFLFEALVGESGRTLDDIVEAVEARADDRYHIFIEGQMKVIKDKFWKAYTYYKSMFRHETLATLRHEFAHEVFSNYGLQNIVLSRDKKDKEKMNEKKKEFLETKDYKKKAELVKSLMAMRAKEERLDMRAANSWLVEGIAAYCETQPPGGRNDRWLFHYQEMLKKGGIYPLESLSVYKIGSFPGVALQSMSYLYAESWAYVTFLMNTYPKEFMEYQKRMSENTAQDFEDVSWLLAAVGKDLRTLDAEFEEYMAQFEELEDPFIVQFEKIWNIFKY